MWEAGKCHRWQMPTSYKKKIDGFHERIQRFHESCALIVTTDPKSGIELLEIAND